MAKRFKTKKKHHLLKLSFMMLIIFISFWTTFNLLAKKISVISVDSTKYLKYLLKTGFNNQLSSFKFFNLFSASSLLDQSLDTNLEINSTEEVVKEITEIKPTSPKVYIYNTHQTEEYKAGTLADYNIKPSVLMASYYLLEKLNDYGVPTILETESITDILKSNNWNYAYSYQASRLLLEQAKTTYPSLEFFIDFHRDSSVYENTTFTIDNKNYVKILFIVGEENENYQENLNITTELNERLKNINPEISRGIYRKKGPGVNGVYNQDFHKNTILMEFGGQYNTIEEVSNTIDLISKTLADFIKEQYEKKEQQ